MLQYLESKILVWFSISKKHQPFDLILIDRSDFNIMRQFNMYFRNENRIMLMRCDNETCFVLDWHVKPFLRAGFKDNIPPEDLQNVLTGLILCEIVFNLAVRRRVIFGEQANTNFRVNTTKFRTQGKLPSISHKRQTKLIKNRYMYVTFQLRS